MSFQVRLDGLFDPDGKYPNPLTGQPYSKHYTKFSLDYLDDEKKKPNGWIKLRTWQDRALILKKNTHFQYPSSKTPTRYR